MKRVLLNVMMLCAVCCNAQDLKYDLNGDGKEDVSDISFLTDYLLNKGNEDANDNLLPGKFSVSATKQVQFSRSNIYWDGSTFHFEENQTDYPLTYTAGHVGHFYWTSMTDYQSGTYMPWAEIYGYSSRSINDKFWCGEDTPIAVDGTDGLYALSGSSSGEWNYLINSRANASSLYKCGVTVGGVANCMVIAPDDFDGALLSSYSLDEVETLGLVCLPPAGNRDGSGLYNSGITGFYWTAKPYTSDAEYAYRICHGANYVTPSYSNYRCYGHSIRLVRNI